VAARRFVANWLSGQDLDAWTAVQLTSELAANVVDHAHTEFAVLIDRRSDRVRVEVLDGDRSRAATTEAAAADDAEHGRGLLLVQALSIDWGIERRPGGKSVYFEVAAEPLPDIRSCRVRQER
jgi:anti-sigma regulatory factor (Ser/Thr protein kinase)